jgi:hypothetical protein
MRTPDRCRVCGEPLAAAEHTTAAEHRRVRIEATWPLLACPAGHRVFPHPDFGAAFIGPFLTQVRRVYASAAPPVRRRLGGLRCPLCRGAVPKRVSDAVTV